jgi:hypothetical protein
VPPLVAEEIEKRAETLRPMARWFEALPHAGRSASSPIPALIGAEAPERKTMKLHLIQLHPIQLVFTHQSTVVAKRRIPDIAKPHDAEPREAVPVVDMDHLVARIIKFIEVLGVEPDIEPMGLALLIGKGIANKNAGEDEVYDITIPIKNHSGVIPYLNLSIDEGTESNGSSESGSSIYPCLPVPPIDIPPAPSARWFSYFV